MKKPHSSQKSIGLILLFVLLTFACSLGENKIPQPEIPLETSVAMTVEAVNKGDVATEASHDGDPTNPPADTEMPAPEVETDTPVPLENTPAPTDIPTNAPTEAPSNTPTPSPTSTMVATSTTVPGDPKIALGSPSWKHTFDSSSGWYLYDVVNYKADIKDGYFTYLIREPKYFSVWTISYPELENYYLEITAFTPADCAGKDRYGLFFGAPLVKTDDGYMFEVSCDGMFRLGWYDGSESEYKSMIGWKSDAAITAGGSQTHRVGVLRDGNNIKLYINGILVADKNNNKFNGIRRFGLMVGSEETDDFEVKYDDIQYWKLP